MTSHELTLRFQRLPQEADFDAPVPVSVKFGENETEAFPFTNPLDDKDLGQIRWYLEKYYDWPTDIDDERARGIEGQLPQWGQALFNAVFQQSANAMRLFDRFNESRQADAVLTIDTTEPRILRLPWELLRDEGGYLFGKNPPISIRRKMHKLTSRPIQPFDLPVRILMVTCRPDGAGFIDPRSIAGPLLDALQEIPEQVEVEFLRPPTLNALDARLRDPHQPRVHIVHFDGHGVFDKTIGLGFLLFEDEQQAMDRVDAERLGTLLNESGVPLMVLNACQSGQPDERNPLASVASRLIESGVGGVVAMNYSVLVETARRFTTHFYGELARGHSAATALDAARRRLFADTRRLTIWVGELGNKEKTLHLQDWFLPALYQQEREIRPFGPHPPAPSPSDREKGGKPESGRGQFPPAPLHGFHGRARELLALERAFAKRHILILHGFGGQGKTALATQTADWFQRTGLFRQAAFVSFETGVGLDFVLNELGNTLVGDNFQIYAGDKVEAIANSLRQTTTLLVWDNFESVLPGGNAPLPADELQRLLDAGTRWAVNGSRLLVTSRNLEIPHTAFMPGVNCQRKELTGLALSDALELAGAILEAHSLPRPRRDPLEALLNFLGGHPLSLQLALPHLAKHTPTQLMVQFKELLPTIQVGEAKERNESLEVSLRFSLDRLGAEAQSWLTRLAVFEGGAWEPTLLQITEIPEATWHALKPQLIATALIRAEELPGVTVPYIHFHPTLAPYLRAQPTDQTQHATRTTRYWQNYYQLANFLYRTDSQNPLPARAIAARELPNLRRALRLCLSADALDEAVTFAAYINRFLDYFGRWRERDEVMGEVERAVSSEQLAVSSEQSPVSSPQSPSALTQREFLLASQQGERLRQQGRAAEAERVFQGLLAGLEVGYERMYIIDQVGRCLEAQGRPAAAAEQYRSALTLAATLEQTQQVKRQTSIYHTDLANVLTDLGRYAEARQEYEAALVIYREQGNDRDVGANLGQLGTLARKMGDRSLARKYYSESLDYWQRLGEALHEAMSWHLLGSLELEGNDLEASEGNYRRALSLYELINDYPNRAMTLNQLAIVAQGAGRLEEAERWYKRAIEGFDQTGQTRYVAVASSNLADLLLAQNRLDEAEQYARQAATIKATLDLSAEPWKTFQILAEIADKRGQPDEARTWRRKGQETFAAFAGSDTQMQRHMQTWQPRIQAIVLAVGGNDEARQAVEQLCDRLAQTDDWKNIAVVVRRILNGERGNDLFDDLDRTDAYLVNRILQALGGGETPSSRPGAPSPSGGEGRGEGGLTLEQLLAFVEQAARGDQDLGLQLFQLLQQLLSDPQQPQELRALAGVLQRILIGDRNPVLDDLPGELASAVRGLVGRLR